MGLKGNLAGETVVNSHMGLNVGLGVEVRNVSQP
jgi:hypothetical protein